jgi:hypothetical protein
MTKDDIKTNDHTKFFSLNSMSTVVKACGKPHLAMTMPILALALFSQNAT